MRTTLLQRMVSEFIGTLFLLAAVVGSGIMGERLAAGNTAIALLANSIATGAALVALILALLPVSGAHFNPAVTLAEALRGGIQWREVPPYIAMQLCGAFAGVTVAHLMFGEPLFFISTHARSGSAQIFGEFVATFGLIAAIFGCNGNNSRFIPFAVGSYITAAYWFTSSTSFANPAVTLARACTNTFSGIRPEDVPGFILAEILGAVAAAWLFHWLLPGRRIPSAEIQEEIV